jgi:hypothetical protein
VKAEGVEVPAAAAIANNKEDGAMGLKKALAGTALAVVLGAALAQSVACGQGQVAPQQATPTGGIVLLDEYWTPDIMVNDVVVTEVDAEQTGDPTQAVSGHFSAMLKNDTGVPNVRFTGAASITIADIPANGSEARLWYRTDAWNGKWRLEISLYTLGLAAPAKAFEAPLDGGGAGGTLIADDKWHQARGPLRPAGDYDVLKTNKGPMGCYVWLAPEDGWNVRHRTFVDRIEIITTSGPLAGRPMVLPVQHVRPMPGAQITAPGLIWWEAEDAVEHTFPPSGSPVTDNAEQQRQLSNGSWLRSNQCAGLRAMWRLQVADAGDYALWCRGAWDGSFRWHWDAGESHQSGPDRVLQDSVSIGVSWTNLGKVKADAGQHMLEIEGMPDAGGMAFDCWVLAREPFKPASEPKPAH